MSRYPPGWAAAALSLLLLAFSVARPGSASAGEGGSAGDPIAFAGYAAGELAGADGGPPSVAQGACRFAATSCWFTFWYRGDNYPYTLTLYFDLPGQRQDLDAGFEVFDERSARVGAGTRLEGQRGVRVWRHAGQAGQRFLVQVYNHDTARLRYELVGAEARDPAARPPSPTATPTASPTPVPTATPFSFFTGPIQPEETPVPPWAGPGFTAGGPEQPEETPAPTPTPAVPARVPVDYLSYLVQSGDSLSSIAEHFDITVGDLMQANGLIDVRDPLAGSIIRIPAFPRVWQGAGRLGRLPSGPAPEPGDFILPLTGPITTPFGGETPFNPMHQAVDIAVDEGTPVHAMRAGVVTAARWSDWEDMASGFGLYVEIAHDGGFTTLYGHLSALTVRVGDSVEQGEVIGLSGNTGLSTGPHLHLMLRRGALFLDPLAYAGFRPATGPPPRTVSAPADLSTQTDSSADDRLFYHWEEVVNRVVASDGWTGGD